MPSTTTDWLAASPGWQAKPWGTNYYAATLANTFLSRKAYLGAPEQADHALAAADVVVPEAGRYLRVGKMPAACPREFHVGRL